ncbi:UDP-2,3-diacylglucosamine diphosphatase [Gilvimarinus sp. SDUM040013]|uniref:UDP-2,3-diacylglucosamine diphosphatase n=1 Tax=Gilvimarinus gilvus TaxID=3058038 RepID=A0ABU4S1T7_9GAMM|nr:UDP-2,3-diacylglucosamine diphosphatase [Gilvimarinus sp. SDUM040013]MDO3388077.1 UDP-2,3-diacylglucosamine diphosphatase [Gilvimarinus sp. SDUM040013]MDX6850985.1 UDP-2,3-diacylglucosamine diphosphatase [Gilvimarinus sp. SDUM040013]
MTKMTASDQSANNRPPSSPDSNPPASLIKGRTIWISDIHLGYRDCKAEYLLEFLDNINCDTLYLVGDIIDMWALKRKFRWPQQHYQVMLKLYELANSGTRVIYVPGNHDEPMRRFCGNFFGPIEIIEEHVYTCANGKRYLIMHGDAMDAYINLSHLTRFFGDIGYNLLLFINRWANRWRKWMGQPYFSLARLIKENIKGAKDAIETYQNEAMDEARRRGFDGVICGHIHYPAMLEQEGIRYCNTGDWIESCTAIVEDFSGEMRLLHYSDQVEWQRQQVASKDTAQAA